MTVQDFKSIYFWEYTHRMAGRAIGLVYALPFAYFALRRRLPSPLVKQLLGVGALFAFQVLSFGGGRLVLRCAQGGLGWYMVKSGLSQETMPAEGVPRVSPYRLGMLLSWFRQRVD